MHALISYERYTGLLSRQIHRTSNPAEMEGVTRFDAAQRQIKAGA